MCYRSKIWFILSNLYHNLLAFRLFKKGSHQRSLFYREEKHAMSLVLAEHLYSIKLFFKYQICLAIKKELDINQVLFHFIQYLDIIQIRMEDHHLQYQLNFQFALRVVQIRNFGKGSLDYFYLVTHLNSF